MKKCIYMIYVTAKIVIYLRSKGRQIEKLLSIIYIYPEVNLCKNVTAQFIYLEIVVQ